MLAIYDRKRAKRRFGSILARALGVPVYTPEDRVPPRTCLVNWGCSAHARGMPLAKWIGNAPDSVALMSHKLAMFKAFQANDVPCLEWAARRETAERWLVQGHVVYARTVLQGHSGEGIVRVKPGENLPDARLYTKAVTGKFREYRVHFFNGEIIAVQIKRRMSPEKMQEMGIVPPDDETRSAIRVYRNGWVFCVNNVNLSEESRDVCKQAMASVDCTSGAVDILVQDGRTLVIETNSAPALRSPTVKAAYVAAIRRKYNAEGY